MARALYSEAELIILDDVLRGLDRETSSTVRIRLFSESDILESGMCTIIMATSMTEHLVDAELAYEMDEEGRIDLFANRERERENRRRIESQRPTQPQASASAANAPSNMVNNEESSGAEATSYELPEAEPAPDNTLRDSLSSKKYGDWTLYKYFLSPAGFYNLAFCTLTIAIAALSDRMPRKSKRSSLFVMCILTTANSDICSIVARP